jgi:uncharacterized protein YkwD
MKRWLRLSLPLGALVLAPPSAARPARGTQPPPAAGRPVADAGALRRALVLGINEERRLAGAPPLAPSAALDQVAQGRAEEIAAIGALPGESDAFALLRRVESRLVRAGYKAHGWNEGIASTVGDAAAVVAYWKQGASFSQAMGHDYQDVGVGIADLNGVPLYTFLFAWPRSEYYGRQTAALHDLDQVRAAMLAGVNDERRKAGSPPLALVAALNAAAQKHAEDMLERTYYSHQSLEGLQPWDRVRAAGFLPQLVGENIAAGHLTVDTALDAWLHSSGHRSNILDPRFTHTGIGIAVGNYEHRYQVLWVQDFARPQIALPQP